VAEQTDYPGGVAEAALAHSVSNKVEAAYRRTEFLEKRRSLMRDWAAYCRGLRRTDVAEAELPDICKPYAPSQRLQENGIRITPALSVGSPVAEARPPSLRLPDHPQLSREIWLQRRALRGSDQVCRDADAWSLQPSEALSDGVSQMRQEPASKSPC